MSNGNAEQPTAQAPRGHSSPNRVEVSEEGRQGAPASNAQGQERSNGQSKELREEQLATAPAGAAAARAGAAGGTTSPQSPGTAARPQPTSGARPGGSPSTPPVHQKQQPAQQTPQKQAPQPSTQQKQGPSPTTQAAASAVAASSTTTATADRGPGRERFRSDAAASSIVAAPGAPGARPAPGAVPVWDPPPPPAPKQGLWTRLGFGRKAERPEGNTAAPPAQQPRVPPTQPAPTTPGGANAPIAAGRSDRSGRAAGWSRRCSRARRPGSAWAPVLGSAWGPSGSSARGSHRSGRCSGCRCGGRSRHPGPSAGTGRTAWHAAQGPVRPGEPTGRTPAAQGGAPGSPVAPPSGPQARMPAGPAAPPTRMPGPPMQPPAPVAIPVPGQETDTLRNQRVDAGAEARPKPTTRRSPRWAWLVGLGRRGCGCRGSIRGR